MVSGLAAARDYLELGIDAIPLYPLSKRARLLAWQKVDPSLQWEGASEADNVGLRCGGSVSFAVLDSDDKVKPTFQALVNFLWGFGLEPGSYPVITTPHNGRHVYLSLVGELPGDYRKFNTNFGAGEFRYGPGALVAAQPSELPDGKYSLIEGDLRNLPRIKVTDILPILSDQSLTAKRENRPQHKPSRRALALLNGQGIESYSTRSEAEQAIITSLVNSGFEFSEVQDLFYIYPAAGKFREIWNNDPRAALRWLKGSYEKAAAFVNEHQPENRKTALSLLDFAQSNPWPGRTGSTDRAVYMAHLAIAIRTAKLIYSAGSRELAELSGVDKITASKANRRLCTSGLLSLHTTAIAQQASTYRLEFPNAYTLYKSVRECTTQETITNHDVFRRQGLGKTAGEVYTALLDLPGQTLGELVKRTGRSKSAVYKALVLMLKMADTYTGEYLPMVEKKGERWNALEADLNKIAAIVGTAGKLKKQKEQHARERAQHRRGLELKGETQEG